jgi:hypothetical protein
MNKHIAKLANQSGFDVDATGKFGNYSEIYRLEKFVELFVCQMSDITDAHTEVFQSDRALIEHIKQSVKQHFGIKN